MLIKLQYKVKLPSSIVYDVVSLYTTVVRLLSQYQVSVTDLFSVVIKHTAFNS